MVAPVAFVSRGFRVSTPTGVKPAEAETALKIRAERATRTIDTI